MRWIAALGLMTLMAGCGVDGAPIRPELSTKVTVGPGGISTQSQASVRKGPLSVLLDL